MDEEKPYDLIFILKMFSSMYICDFSVFCCSKMKNKWFNNLTNLVKHKVTVSQWRTFDKELTSFEITNEMLLNFMFMCVHDVF